MALFDGFSQRGLGVADENLASLRDTQGDRGLVGALIALAAVIAFGSVFGSF